jgi:hypothetical protein
MSVDRNQAVWREVVQAHPFDRGFDDPWVAAPAFSVPPKPPGDGRSLNRRLATQDVRATFLALAEMGRWFGDQCSCDPESRAVRWRTRAVVTEMMDMCRCLLEGLDEFSDNQEEME